MAHLEFQHWYSSIFWMLLCFGICFAFSTLLFLPRVRKVQSARKELIDVNNDKIVHLRDDIVKLEEQYESMILSAKKKLHKDSHNMILSFASDMQVRIRKFEAECQKKLEKYNVILDNIIEKEVLSKSNVIIQSLKRDSTLYAQKSYKTINNLL